MDDQTYGQLDRHKDCGAVRQLGWSLKVFPNSSKAETTILACRLVLAADLDLGLFGRKGPGKCLPQSALAVMQMLAATRGHCRTIYYLSLTTELEDRSHKSIGLDVHLNARRRVEVHVQKSNEDRFVRTTAVEDGNFAVSNKI
jgi:hypothetical protein